MKNILMGLLLTMANTIVGSVALAQFDISITFGQNRMEQQYQTRAQRSDMSEMRGRRFGIDAVCSQYHQRNSNRSCFMDFDGEQRGVCEACTENKSCFMAFNGINQKLCEAYKENKSCFMAFDGEDRGWCEVIKEGKSCFMALNGRARDLCEQGRVPRHHRFWL